MTTQASNGFTRLPRELLTNILAGVDNGTVLACIELSPLLNEVGVETVLRRHKILDPSAFCELEISVPERLPRHSITPYVLAALLASRRQYSHISQLSCTIHPPPGLHVMIHAAPMRRAARSEISPRDSLKDRMMAAFRPLIQFLSRVGQLEEVTIKVWDWTHFPDGLGEHLEKIVHLAIQKGCHTLQFRCAHEPTLIPWTFVYPRSPHRFGVPIAALLSKLTCGVFGSFPSTPHAPPPFRRGSLRLAKLNADALFFHPTGVLWMTDLFSQCLTNLTLSFSFTSPSGLYFTGRGLAALFKGVPRLQSLTVLNANEEVIRSVVPSLRSFAALKHFTLYFDGLGSFPSTPRPGVVEKPFVFPPGIERLAISPQLIEYVLPGAVTVRGLKEIQLMYCNAGGTRGEYIPPISKDIASVRQAFGDSEYSAHPSIAISVWAASDVFPFHQLLAFAQKTAAQDQTQFSSIDAIHIECGLRALELEESRRKLIDLIGMFPKLTRVVVERPRDFRRKSEAHPDLTTESVTRDVLRSISSKFEGLTQVRIGEEEYTKP